MEQSYHLKMSKLIYAYKRQIIIFITALYVLLAFVGAFVHFSPVPHSDMWDAYIGFFNGLHEGNYAAWWNLHNEHRIFLTRLVSWLDFHLFNGSLVFLIVLNYFFASAIFVIFLLIARSVLSGENDKDLRFVVFITLCFFSFSWIQRSNFEWAFQSQFFAAQVFPLLAFYCLYLSCARKHHATGFFLLAVFMGVSSIGTMANGILALPFMILMGLILRIGFKKILILFIFSCLCFYLYFYNSPLVESHNSLLHTMINQPVEFIQYALLYLGNPFAFMLKRSAVIGQLAGAFFVVSCVYFTFIVLRSPKKYSLQVMLFTFIAYIVATAVITAGGRAVFGLETATASRYTTPSLMAWSALLIIYVSLFKQQLLNCKNKIYWILLIPALLIPYQIRALHEKDEMYFNRLVAVLALELGVYDTEQLRHTYPLSAERLLSLATLSKEYNWSIFNHSQLKNAADILGTDNPINSQTECLGNIDVITKIKETEDYLKVEGWLYTIKDEKVPKKVFLVNKNNIIVGYAITGLPRDDLPAFNAGFKGYILAEYAGDKILIFGNDPDCYLRHPYHPFWLSDD